MKALLFLLVATSPLLLDAGSALGDDGPQERRYRLGATLYAFAVPEQPDFLVVVAPVDIRWFHLEGRYNYESLHTGALFVGLTGRTGDRLRLEATAMLGGLMGDIDGVAPALRCVLTVWRIDVSAEAEYVIDFADASASFFYSWSELGISPLPWLRMGVVGQRTRILNNGLDIQRGLFVGATLLRAINITFYELNLGWIAPTYVGALGVNF
jgi:hypothetical protein